MDVNVKRKISAKNLLTQQAHGSGLVNGSFQTFLGQAIFSTHVDVAFRCADCVSRNGHGFQDTVRVAFQYQAVFEGSRFTFIRIADDVFRRARGPGDETPFGAGGKTGSTPAAQPGFLDLPNHISRRHFGQDFADGLVAIMHDVIIDTIRVDDARPFQHDPMFGR